MKTLERETEIRTKAWLHYISNQTGVDIASPSALERKTGQPKQYWVRYRNWAYHGKDNPPSKNTRKLVENEGKVKGSLGIYDIGPEMAPLWIALWSNKITDLFTAVDSVSERIQLPKTLANIIPAVKNNSEPDEIDINTAEIYIQTLIKCYNELIIFSALTDSTIQSTQSNNDSQALLNLHDIAALIAAYRLCRSYLQGNYTATLSRCIKILLGNHIIRTTLSNYGVFHEVANALFEMIPELHPIDNDTTLTSIIITDDSASEITKYLKSNEIIKNDLISYLSVKITAAWANLITLDDIRNGAKPNQLTAAYSKLTAIRNVKLSPNKDIESFVTKYIEAIIFIKTAFQETASNSSASRVIDLGILDAPSIHEEILQFNKRGKLAA